MPDTPEEKEDEALPDVHIWIGNRFNDETIDDVIRVEEVPADDPNFTMESNDEFTPNAVDDHGEEIEIMEIVIRVFRRRQEE